MTAQELKKRRVTEGIPSFILAAKVGKAASLLSAIECGRVRVSLSELDRFSAALDELIQAKAAIEHTAEEHGWPASGMAAF
jgi:predicted transcriptional regulator